MACWPVGLLIALAIAGAAAQVAPSLSPPGGLPPAVTPQFVLLTHDDSVPGETHANMVALTEGRKTADGCPVTATMFVCTSCYAQNQCGLVKDLWARGFEVADHSVKHENMLDWTFGQIKAEVLAGRTAIAACGVPARDVVGWRTPYLKTKPAMRQALVGSGFLYDSSLVEDTTGKSLSRGMGTRLWPWGMGNGLPNNCTAFASFQRCSTNERYPGIYQVPLWELEGRNGRYKMDYGVSEDGAASEPVFDLLKAAFDAAYAGNRAPLPLFLHSPYLKAHLADLQRFVDYALSRPHTYFVTMRQLVAWVKAPVGIRSGLLTPARLGCGQPGGAPGGPGTAPRPSPPPPSPKPSPPPPPSPRPPSPALPLDVPSPALPLPSSPAAVGLSPSTGGLSPSTGGLSPSVPVASPQPVVNSPAPVPNTGGLSPSVPVASPQPVVNSPAPVPSPAIASAPSPAVASTPPPAPLAQPSPSPDPLPPMPPAGVRITLMLAGVDRAEFARVTEKHLLLVLTRELGVPYSAAFVASVEALPAGSAAAADLAAAAAANGTAVALGRRRRALLDDAEGSVQHSLPAKGAGGSRRGLAQAAAAAPGSAASAEWLSVVVVVGGDAPLRMFNDTLRMLRGGEVRDMLALSGAYLAADSVVVPFSGGADLALPSAAPAPAPAEVPALAPVADFAAPAPLPAEADPATAPAPAPLPLDSIAMLPTPPLPAPASEAATAASSGGGAPVGAIVGGVLGGLLAVAAAVAAAVWAWRRRASRGVAAAGGKHDDGAGSDKLESQASLPPPSHSTSLEGSTPPAAAAAPLSATAPAYTAELDAAQQRA